MLVGIEVGLQPSVATQNSIQTESKMGIKNSQASLPKLMNSQEVCEYFSISRRTLDDWIARRDLPFGRKIGGKWYWPADRLTEWLLQGADQ